MLVAPGCRIGPRICRDGAAIVDVFCTGTVDTCRKYTALAIMSVNVRLHSGVKGCAGDVAVEIGCGRTGDDDILVET